MLLTAVLPRPAWLCPNRLFDNSERIERGFRTQCVEVATARWDNFGPKPPDCPRVGRKNPGGDDAQREL